MQCDRQEEGSTSAAQGKGIERDHRDTEFSLKGFEGYGAVTETLFEYVMTDPSEARTAIR